MSNAFSVVHVVATYAYFMAIMYGRSNLNNVFAERVKNKSTEKKIQDPAVIRTLDLLNTSQMLLPTWTSGRGAEDKLHVHKQHCLEASAPIDTHSSSQG